MSASVPLLERNVEQRRAKLARDLERLRAPATITSFKEELGHEAVKAKDATINSIKDSLRSNADALVDDLKAKAAANPMAALLIGAGIGWRLFRNPPIATALIGAGLIGLMRTSRKSHFRASDADYIQQAKDRLKTQASELASATKSTIGTVGDAIAEKSGELVDIGKGQVEKMTETAAEIAGGVNKTINQTIHDTQDYVSNAASRAQAVGAQALSKQQSILEMNASRDTLLLGAAAVAVSAALGLSYQKHKS